MAHIDLDESRVHCAVSKEVFDLDSMVRENPALALGSWLTAKLKSSPAAIRYVGTGAHFGKVASGFEGRGVAGLVEEQFAASGNFHGGEQSPACVGDGAGELDAFRFELFDGGVDVVAHKVKLVTAFFGFGVGGVNA